jgi:hypothetical protein
VVVRQAPGPVPISFVVLRAASIQGQFDSVVFVKNYLRSSSSCGSDLSDGSVTYTPTTVSVLLQQPTCGGIDDNTRNLIIGISVGVGVPLVIGAVVLGVWLSKRARGARAREFVKEKSMMQLPSGSMSALRPSNEVLVNPY